MGGRPGGNARGCALLARRASPQAAAVLTLVGRLPHRRLCDPARPRGAARGPRLPRARQGVTAAPARPARMTAAPPPRGFSEPLGDMLPKNQRGGAMGVDRGWWLSLALLG